MRSFLLVAVLAQLETQQALQVGDVIEKFEEFVTHFKRDYKTTSEFIKRMKAFSQNLRKTVELQRQDPGATYSHLTKFADWTEAEFEALNTLQEPPAREPLSNACNSDADQKIWSSTGFTQFDDYMDTCGRKCWGEEKCVTKCVKESQAYSDECATCFGQLSDCTQRNCMFACMKGKTDKCVTCVTKHCSDPFVACSGVTPPAAALRTYKKTGSLPASWDWREHGAVNTVKDQAQCGSCWAFGTVGNIEGANVVQGKNPLVSLSEQELVDCSSSDNGCNGGLPMNAYKDMLKDGMSLTTESAYAYHAAAGQCQTEQGVVAIDDWKMISKDEDEIAEALVKYGPLAIGIHAQPLQTYKGGIADPKEQCGLLTRNNHAVVIVGYGSEGGKDYWIVRNSWGAGWGEDGYFRIVRGQGRCGVNKMVTTAIINPKEQSIVV